MGVERRVMGERRASRLGNNGSAAGSVALFASSATTIFASIAFFRFHVVSFP
jgi:dolichol kinase